MTCTTIRFDPQAHFALLRTAALQERSAAAYVRTLVRRALSEVQVWRKGGDPVSLDRAMQDVWDADSAVRLARIANAYPDLMTGREEALWRQICSDTECWRVVNRGRGGAETPRWSTQTNNLDAPAVHRLYGEHL